MTAPIAEMVIPAEILGLVVILGGLVAYLVRFAIAKKQAPEEIVRRTTLKVAESIKADLIEMKAALAKLPVESVKCPFDDGRIPAQVERYVDAMLLKIENTRLKAERGEHLSG